MIWFLFASRLLILDNKGTLPTVDIINMDSNQHSGSFRGSPPPDTTDDNPFSYPNPILDHHHPAILRGLSGGDNFGRKLYAKIDSGYATPDFSNSDMRLPPHQRTTAPYRLFDEQSFVPVWDFPGHNPHEYSLLDRPEFATTAQRQSLDSRLLLPPVLTYDDILARPVSQQGIIGYDSHYYDAPARAPTGPNGTGYGMIDRSIPDYSAVASFGLSGHDITGSTSATRRALLSHPQQYENSQHRSQERNGQNDGFLLQSTLPLGLNAVQSSSQRQQGSLQDNGPTVTYIFDSSRNGVDSPWSVSATDNLHYDPQHGRWSRFN